MGRLIDGKWVKTSIITSDDSGAYDRIPRSFLDKIGSEKYPAESGRYHLYVSYACPWAHRTLIMRELKGLSEHISLSVVHPDMLEYGWKFDSSFAGATEDHLFNKSHLHEIYTLAQSDVSTSVTVPVLFDKSTNSIVNNESSEIIRIFNTAFNSFTNNKDDYYPEHLQSEINQWNDEIYDKVNNGVYKAGFSKSQKAYDKAVTELFQCLDKLDKHLDTNQYLVGEKLTEADIRLLTSLIRFDDVYAVHFKCSYRKIKDYKNLSAYLQRLFELPAVKKTTFMDHIKRHYYYSHEELNPCRIIAKTSSVIYTDEF
ncbi:MAG: glutathione-dependent reductase [Bdellovibrionaceae bacterium]|nr:glutathione-dependent reductase [Pseudobdellovibrionaceae bacterium]|tara:strand:- start:63744 stop:64682 length:939 start_codon:yes stop_codon:yes gene_type:complete